MNHKCPHCGTVFAAEPEYVSVTWIAQNVMGLSPARCGEKLAALEAAGHLGHMGNGSGKRFRLAEVRQALCISQQQAMEAV